MKNTGQFSLFSMIQTIISCKRQLHHETNSPFHYILSTPCCVQRMGCIALHREERIKGETNVRMIQRPPDKINALLSARGETAQTQVHWGVGEKQRTSYLFVSGTTVSCCWRVPKNDSLECSANVSCSRRKGVQLNWTANHQNWACFRWG